MTSLQAFAAGAALCSTSLGTTFTILKTSGLSKSRLGIVLAGAAMMDDVVGLVLVQIISDIGRSPRFQAVTLVRPITVSIAYAVVVPLLCLFIVSPLTKKIQKSLQSRTAMRTWLGSKSFTFCLHSAILVAFVATTGYAGTSNLFGSYIAGACISWWDESFNENQTSSSEELAHNTNDQISRTSNANSRKAKVSPTIDADGNNTREESADTSEQASSKINLQQPVQDNASTVHVTTGEQRVDDGTDGKVESVLGGAAIYNEFYAGSVNRVLKPLFFASIGFSIPIARMFTRELVWRGIVYSILMIFGKLVCGLWLVRFRIRLPSIASSRVMTKFRAVIMALSKHKSRSSQCDTGTSREQTSRDAVSNSDATMQLQRSRAAESIDRPDTVLSKPISLYPAAILGMAMVSRGEIGFLVSAVAQNSGLYDTKEAGGSHVFLVVTWAILSCTILGPMITGLLVKRVWRMQKQERGQRSGRVDPLGIWGATS
ncbi:hypothetical protein MRB53_038978 [Persea americana]|nr:hypothetical protein MRB53_038978 [Persea americana]